ncbi:epoxide hydrolase [Cyathus striatus]|nr:epoxide hydrolase [Cyathus striatus]
MDPHRPLSFAHTTSLLSTGRTYHFVDQLPHNYHPNRNPTLLCVHGFPDLWYGWRNQIGPWVRNGYRVVAPDMLGYGGTDKPFDPAEYSTKKLCADLAALLDLLAIKQAILVGHDWGSYTVGRFALWYPDRLLALVILSVPYTPPSPHYMPIEKVAQVAPNLGYQVYFASQESTNDISKNLKTFLSLMFRTPKTAINFTPLGYLERLVKELPPIEDNKTVLTDDELDYYYQQLGRGMNGPLNYYRTFLHRHEEEFEAKLPAKLHPDLPVLYIWGTKDPSVTQSVISKSHKFIAKLQDVAVEGRGHWLMVEAKDEVTCIISEWLHGLVSSPIKREGKL